MRSCEEAADMRGKQDSQAEVRALRPLKREYNGFEVKNEFIRS
jgi:hypothetical protein